MIAFRPAPAADAPSAPAASCLRATAQKMADTMREMAFAGENVTPETLEARGFPRAVTGRLGARAVEIARRSSIRQVGDRQGPAGKAEGEPGGTEKLRRSSIRQVGDRQGPAGKAEGEPGGTEKLRRSSIRQIGDGR